MAFYSGPYKTCQSVCGQEKYCGNTYCTLHPHTVAKGANNNRKPNYNRKPRREYKSFNLGDFKDDDE